MTYTSVQFDGETQDSDDISQITAYMPEGEHRCKHCSQPMTDNGGGEYIIEDDEDDITCDDNEETGKHEPVPTPLSWANHASIFLDDDEDSITLAVSVGDPRGAFTFTLRRNPVDGALYMSTPYPGESLPHRETEEVRPGFLRIK